MTAQDGQAQVSVSASGQALYSLPIAVPPGVAGMVPQLALSYTDGGINGPVGVGWSLQGVSMITRCPSTRPTDGKARTVFFDADDRLCLDGQRLVQTDASGKPVATTSDAAGLSGTTYREFRTEKDSFVRVRAYGHSTHPSSQGPAYFKVWTKSGQIYTYGALPEVDTQALVLANQSVSPLVQVVAVWAVRRIADVMGNYIDFHYTQRDVSWGSGVQSDARAGHEWNLAEIRYTGNDGPNLSARQEPANRVVFTYADRDNSVQPGHDRAEAYQLGHKNLSVQRLTSIQTYVNAHTTTRVPARVYRLAYDRSPVTGRSRLTKVTMCAGASETVCMPATSFTYGSAAAPVFTAHPGFAASDLATLRMTDSGGAYGVLTGDFNGDGRTDLLRWSTTTSLNELHFSQGDGTFRKATTLTLTDQTLFKSDGCYFTTAADFNGDSLTDLLRVARSGCATAANKIFLSVGDGTFTVRSLASGIDLDTALAKVTVLGSQACQIPQTSPSPASLGSRVRPPVDPPAPADEQRYLARAVSLGAVAPSAGGSCSTTTRTLGKNFLLIDVNGDGLLDIVTTVAPAYNWNSGWGPVPPESEICAGSGVPSYSGPCSRVYLAQSDGSHVELATSNVRNSSLYVDPPDPLDIGNPYWRRPNLADINGDGLQDVMSTYAGRWRSHGDGNFTVSDVQDGSQLCSLPLDFNGDQRTDCLRTSSTASAQQLTVSYGSSSSGVIAQFNLTSTGNHLYARDGDDKQTVGVWVDDVDADGRSDLLRWGPSPSDNGVYLSNGDGSFRSRIPAGLDAISRALQGADRKTGFAIGDFLGNGTQQILHLKHKPSLTGDIAANTNQLYERPGAGVAPDLLQSSTSATGLVTTIGPRVSIAQSSTYVSDRGTGAAGQGQVIDIQPPMYVISSLTRDSGNGSTLTSQYQYHGLKAERDGRGLLGFREFRQTSPAPDGSALTSRTIFVQQHPYAGVASRAETYLGGLDLSGRLISRTANSYCEPGAVVAPSAITDTANPPSPCATTAKVARPYLHQSVEEGWDLDASGSALPKVTTTNTYNASLDPTQIVVKTTGTSLGIAQTFTRTSTHTYEADKTSGDQWILGRLSTATVRHQVPNLLPSISTSAGTAPGATDQNGTGPRPLPAPPAASSLSAVLGLLLSD